MLDESGAFVSQNVVTTVDVLVFSKEYESYSYKECCYCSSNEYCSNFSRLS